MADKVGIDDTVLAVAAQITDRAHELISDGWVKGHFSTPVPGTNIPEKFCILGALWLALDEMFPGNSQKNKQVYALVLDLAEKFILDEMLEQYAYKGRSIPSFNDASERKHEEVLNVLDQAKNRLWNLTSDCWDDYQFEFSKWSDLDSDQMEAAKQYMHAVIA